MLTLYRNALSILMLPLTIELAAAHESDKQLTPSQICSRLMQNIGEGVMISGESVAIVPRNMFSIHRAVSPSARLLALHLSKLPFGKKVMQDIPALGQATWYSWGEFVGSDMQSNSGRNFHVALSSRGVIEIKVHSKLSPQEDQSFYSQIISLLQNEDVEAGLTAETKIEPFKPSDGFDLLISRLDANNHTTRIGIAKLLAFLKHRG